ncbi:MAG: hypothetical protein JOZ70_09135 [Pseudolabrys sp.]|nr:hypothetical protein [Pseudolabrys sp.]
MQPHVDGHGFAPPRHRPLGRERRTSALAALVITVALAVGTLVAATVVSAGLARAAALGLTNIRDGVAIAVLAGLLFAGLASMAADVVELRRRRDD